MFSLGFYEWIVIFFAIILCVKPEDYPRLFRFIGQTIRKLDTMWKNISNEFDIYGDK